MLPSTDSLDANILVIFIYWEIITEMHYYDIPIWFKMIIVLGHDYLSKLNITDNRMETKQGSRIFLLGDRLSLLGDKQVALIEGQIDFPFDVSGLGCNNICVFWWVLFIRFGGWTINLFVYSPPFRPYKLGIFQSPRIWLIQATPYATAYIMPNFGWINKRGKGSLRKYRNQFGQYEEIVWHPLWTSCPFCITYFSSVV